MTTVIVDPDGISQVGTTLPPQSGFKRTPIRERLGVAIDPEGDCIRRNGEPCILFAQWDYREDWSGEFVRETHAFSLIGEGCVTVTPEEWWEVMRKTHQKHDA
jgi:hypothetical protein